MRKIAVRLWLISLYYVSGCGGGGSSPAPPVSSAATKAIITFSTSLASGRSDTFGSVEFTADLPAGVTVPADNSGMIDANNLVPVEKALAVSTQAVLGSYTPPGNGLPAKVHVAIITLDASGGGAGMSPGKFAILTCDLAPGSPISDLAFAQPRDVVITDSAEVSIPASDVKVSSVTTLQ